MALGNKIESILDLTNASVQVFTLGRFEVFLHGDKISSKSWGRDKTVQLFQFMLASRKRGGLHKEQIMDRLWEEYDDQGFKVALHGINKVLEPNRKSRSEPKYIVRQGSSYYLDHSLIWVDADALEQLITYGNNIISEDPKEAARAYSEALNLHRGSYLPNRLFEDWTSGERERLNILIIGTYIHLAELIVDHNPQESIRLCQQALIIDDTWEDAYRVQMKAYLKMGNRPMALKTYKKCRSVILDEFGVEPLPVTQELASRIKNS